MGLGNRGTKYAEKQLKYPDEMEVVAIADPRRVRLDSINKILHLPEDRVFESGEALLDAPRLADVLIIATQDAQHKNHAIRALEKGYDLLLEKPIAITKEDCIAIRDTAERLGRRVLICHVLRYTPFYQQIKRVISEGTIGDVVTVQAEEEVGYYHYAHSYVRGNWHNREKSSPMILAKCSHDMDLFLWLTGKKCEKVSSYGSLSYFKKENCPEGATDRCTDGCPVEDCPYHAQKFYFSRIPGWPSSILHPEPTEENILEALKTTDYGRCVYKMDNNVVDHQVVNLLMEDGVTVNFTMTGFTSRQTRRIHIMGTKGEIEGETGDRKFKIRVFGKEEQEFDVTPLCDDFSGHEGGDARLIYDVIRLFRGDDFDTSSITTLARSVESHLVAFAAEESRLNGGESVDMKNFEK